jgi:hypothetical protein
MTVLPVDAARVVAVLLADGWHHIRPGSFSVGALPFGPDGAGDGLGYYFEEATSASPYGPATFAGPLSAVLAMRQAAQGRWLHESGRDEVRFRGRSPSRASTHRSLRGEQGSSGAPLRAADLGV